MGEEEVEMRGGGGEGVGLLCLNNYNDKELFTIAVMYLLLGIKICIIRRFRW